MNIGLYTICVHCLQRPEEGIRPLVTNYREILTAVAVLTIECGRVLSDLNP